MTVEILEAAKRDLLDCYWFYEMQAPGVGAYFLKHLKTEIDSLANYAGIHRRLHGRYHCMVSRKFPHIIYYHVQDQTALVDAVIDGRRSPEWIKQRLK